MPRPYSGTRLMVTVLQPQDAHSPRFEASLASRWALRAEMAILGKVD